MLIQRYIKKLIILSSTRSSTLSMVPVACSDFVRCFSRSEVVCFGDYVVIGLIVEEALLLWEMSLRRLCHSRSTSSALDSSSLSWIRGCVYRSDLYTSRGRQLLRRTSPLPCGFHFCSNEKGDAKPSSSQHDVHHCWNRTISGG